MDLNKQNISVVGLGYVGLPLAIELAKKYTVVGFDINEAKLNKYRSGIDVTDEVGGKALTNTSLKLTSDTCDLGDCSIHIIAVPTPINHDKTPNLKPINSASELVGNRLNVGDIVVYESTVYPGTTEEVCVPILEKASGLKFGQDFTVGYSPERINPGDKKNTLTKIVKVVSGSDEKTLDVLSELYGSIITAGIYKAKSIKVAEACKIVENTQRDVNIAFMNELSRVFDAMEIRTKDVLDAASTKWNFLKFSPGLVGGHCIGVDPYYFIYKADLLGYHSEIIHASRKINDSTGLYIASAMIKKLIAKNVAINKAKVGILGITFKENCADVRNTKVIDIINELESYGVTVIVHDPMADREEVSNIYGIDLASDKAFTHLDAVVVAVAHKAYVDGYDLERYQGMLNPASNLFVDIKSIYDNEAFEKAGMDYWSL